MRGVVWEMWEVCEDVVVRFKAYDGYGSPECALRALRRRAPGYSLEDYATAFKLLCEVYDKSVQAIKWHRREPPDKTLRVAEFEDIDFDACMQELDELSPGVAINQKREILEWVIFWHYLK